MARRRRSQYDIAGLLGIAQSAINDRLACRTSWRGEELYIVAQYLDVPVERLYPASVGAAA